jgi:hypothetical protein
MIVGLIISLILGTIIGFLIGIWVVCLLFTGANEMQYAGRAGLLSHQNEFGIPKMKDKL